MKKAEARRRIFESAATLFHEKGYSMVGINEIIDRAETAKATFYHHFPTKESLCVAWLESVKEARIEQWEDLLHSDKSPPDKISEIFESLHVEEGRFRGCPFSNTAAMASQSDQKIQSVIFEYKGSAADYFEKFAGQVAGAEKSRPLGRLLFNLYTGVATEIQNSQSNDPLKEVIPAVRRLCQCF